MNSGDLDLPAMREPLREALAVYESHYGGDLRFGDFPELAPTPEKPNSARTVVPVSYKGLPPLDMYTIVFLPHDGTGDANTYPLGELDIPDYLQFAEKPERVIPRSKRGVDYEGFFPLFSVAGGDCHMFASSLAELRTAGPEERAQWERMVPGGKFTWGIQVEGFLGSYPSEFSQRLQAGFQPQVWFTTGTRNGQRFGDPHAIYNPFESGLLQVGGFLAVKDEAHPIRAITGDWATPLPLKYD